MKIIWKENPRNNPEYNFLKNNLLIMKKLSYLLLTLALLTLTGCTLKTNE
jgi:hypothetical protein